MRLWSIHPKYLDAKGLVALWRESLLAKAVLENKTSGYKNHPQLLRFKEQKKQIKAINHYLSTIHEEAINRGYKFDKNKFNKSNSKIEITVTDKQVLYEFDHLKNKLKIRDQNQYNKIKNINFPELNSTFKLVKGDIASWEKIN